jgi:acyl-CoA dehydrogenase
MRGTCSSGFMLQAGGTTDQIFADPYHKIHAETVMPVAHLMWSAVWAGAAASAVERARTFIRASARKSGGQLPPGAAHLTRAVASLSTLLGLIGSSLQRFEALPAGDRQLQALDFQTTMNLLKVNASELAIAIVVSALQACGLSGYRNDGEFSVSRQLRDVQSSSIMINNDRILANVANAALLVEVPGSLAGWSASLALGA